MSVVVYFRSVPGTRSGVVNRLVTPVNDHESMDASITLGLQPPGTLAVFMTTNGAPPAGVLRQQSEPCFPRPGRRARVIFFIAIVLLTATGAITLGMTGEPSAMWAALLIPVLLGLPATFLWPAFRAARDRSSCHSASGIVIATDHAGMVHGEDAQQRALIHIEHDGSVRWLAATQHGLRLAEGDKVFVSWASARSESCYVHGTLAGPPRE